METTLRIELKDVYGRTLAYPADLQSTKLAEIAGAKTLSFTVLASALTMGFDIMLVSRGVDLKPLTRDDLDQLLPA